MLFYLSPLISAVFLSSLTNNTHIAATTQRQHCYNGCDLYEIGDMLHPGKIVFNIGGINNDTMDAAVVSQPRKVACSTSPT